MGSEKDQEEANSLSLKERVRANDLLPESTASLRRRELELKLREQKFWYIKAVAPYIAIFVTVIGLVFTYIHERDADRRQHELEQNRASRERETDKAEAGRFFAQLQESRREADTSHEQSERHHQEELFERAVSQLGSNVPMERVAAIYALSEFSRNIQFRDRATTSMATLLEEDTDPSTENALYKAFDLASASDIDGLARANIQAQVLLARAYGRYVGIEMGHKFPGALENYPSPDAQKEQSEYERQVVIGEPVSSVYYHRRPVEEIVSHEFIRDGFWLQSFPDTQREIFNGEKNAAWTIPPTDYSSGREAALTDIRHATRYLELTSSILESILRKKSGRVTGWDLTSVYFVVADFRRVDLHGIILSKAHLEMADLRGANLSYATCVGTDFDGANFSGAKLVHANLNQADLNQIQPFPIDTPTGHTHTYILLNTNMEELRYKDADFKDSSWRKAHSISAGLQLYLNKNF
jgi:hypothetical protein